MTTNDGDDEEPTQTLKDLHSLLMETSIASGKLVCGNCGHEYAVKEGIVSFVPEVSSDGLRSCADLLILGELLAAFSYGMSVPARGGRQTSTTKLGQRVFLWDCRLRDIEDNDDDLDRAYASLRNG